MPIEASPAWALARALQKKVDEARYLTAENAHRYRPIMRYFYEQHMAHQYTLTGDDVLAHMRAFVDRNYTEEQCEQDLRQLAEWGNLLSEQDRTRAKTVEEFLRRQLRYQITPYGIAFERLLLELEEARGGGGSLDVSLLELLYEHLVQLGGLVAQVACGQGDAPSPVLSAPAASGAASTPSSATLVPSEPALRRIFNLWNQAYEAFDKVGQQASDYLAALHRSRQEDLADIEVFLAYKDVLLQYLNSFVTGLFDFGDRIRSILAGYVRENTHEALLQSLIAYETHHVPGPEGRLPAPQEVRSRREREWREMHRWFEPRGGLETLRRRTTGTIERVVRQSQRLMDRRSGLSRRRELEQLAVAFAHCAELDQAHRLAGATLGCITPRHILGSAEAFTMAPTGSVWKQPGQELALRPISSRGQRKRGRSAPVPYDDETRQAVLRDALARRQDEAAIWDRLFASGEVNLGRLELDDPVMRARLLHVLARCLASSDRTTVVPDGSRISLHLPDPPEPGELRAPDGTLALPQFVLRRHPGHSGQIGYPAHPGAWRAEADSTQQPAEQPSAVASSQVAAGRDDA